MLIQFLYIYMYKYTINSFLSYFIDNFCMVLLSYTQLYNFIKYFSYF